MLEPKNYQKMPIPIQAMKFIAENEFEATLAQPEVQANWEALRRFANYLVRSEEYHDGTRLFYVYDRLHDTWVRFAPGDWIARGIKGEFYPIEKDVFDATYEESK